MIRDLPVYVTIGWDRASDSIRALGPAVEVRAGLREAGRDAFLLSLDRGLDLLLRERRRGVVFPIEEELDGSPIGVRERIAASLPVVGNSLDVVRRATDKWQAKAIMAGAGLSVPGAVLVRDLSDPPALTWPRVVKPRIGRGGSVGVHYAEDAGALCALAGGEGLVAGELLLEEYVAGDEYTVWVFGPDPRPDQLVPLPVPRGDRPILDRDSKVNGVRLADGQTRSDGCPDPAPQLRRALQRAAVDAHRAVGADAYSRVDMIARGGEPFVLEINPAPRIFDDGLLSVATGQRFSFPAFLVDQVDAAQRRAEAAR